eukprot:m51a1_g2713 putative nucleolar protein 14 (898) ;mRNA; r:829883-832773
MKDRRPQARPQQQAKAPRPKPLSFKTPSGKPRGFGTNADAVAAAASGAGAGPKRTSSGPRVVMKDSAFERRKVRPKHVIDGRRVQAAEAPAGQARAEGIELRKRTLLMEMKHAVRRNAFADRRAGENDASLNADEKALARWHRERAARASRAADMYNLDDDAADVAHSEFSLTHGGQSLGDIADLGADVPRGYDSDDDVYDGDVSAHFGGGEEGGEAKKSARSAYDEVIARSKQRKAERQQHREELKGMLGQVDDDFATLREVVMSDRRDNTEPEPPADPNAWPASLQAQLEALQSGGADALKRVREEQGAPTGPQSADAEDDDYEHEHVHDDDDDEDGEEHEHEHGCGHHCECHGEPAEKRQRTGDKKQQGASADDDEFERLVRTLTFEAKAPASDRLKTPEEKARERREALERLEKERADRMNALSHAEEGQDAASDDDDEDDEQARLRKRAGAAQGALSREALANMPYTFSVPESDDKWAELSGSWPAPEREVAVRRIVTYNHPTLSDENAEALTSFLGTLLRSELSDAHLADPQARGCAYRAVFALSQELGGDRAAVAFREHLRAVSPKGDEWPSAQALHAFKTVCDVFSSSDFRHPVVTPVLLSCARCLHHTAIETREQLQTALFLCCLVRHVCARNARLFPEAVSALTDIVRAFAGVEKKRVAVDGIAASVPSESDVGPEPLLPLPGCEPSELEGKRFLAAALRVALSTLAALAKQMSGVQHVRALLLPAVEAASKLPKPWLKHHRIAAAVAQIEAAVKGERTRADGTASSFPTFRTIERKNPVGIKEFAPKIDEQRKRAPTGAIDEATPSQAAESLRRLKRAQKRHFKDAKRELRKDTAFITAERNREQEVEDEAIKQAGKRIMTMLQDDQREAKVERKRKEREKRKLRL